MPIKLKHTISRGADYRVTVRFRESSDTPIDLTGYQFDAELQSMPGISITPLTVQPVAAGDISVSLSHEHTQFLTHKRYKYALRMTTPLGVVSYPVFVELVME